ncbi:kinase-like domain-containing protein [Phanerochaete sordida]|uniref:mitogen-activated protein kinase kinase kinase n=1 Tax=Phanerochaete sordida TaxID=48140 RepID=A0A9P3LFB6_9APHY|nr:kinase-like domain-containing protein [Phanerochaete sordida]
MESNIDNDIEAHYIRTFFCKALYDYQHGDDPDSNELRFRRGDIIEVLTRLESGWWDGLLGEQRGWFPSNYVAAITDSEACAALAAFTGQAESEAEEGRPSAGSVEGSSDETVTEVVSIIPISDDRISPTSSEDSEILYELDIDTQEEQPPPPTSYWSCERCEAAFVQKDMARLHVHVKHLSNFEKLQSQSETAERWITARSRTEPITPLEFSCGVLAGKVLSMSSFMIMFLSAGYNAYQVLESLTLEAQDLSLSSSVNFLITVALHRPSILKLAKHVRRVISSLSESEKKDIMGLRGDRAADVLDLINVILPAMNHIPQSPWDHLFQLYDVQQSRRLQDNLSRIFVRLCESSLQLPRRLYLSEVRMQSQRAAAKGSFGEIFEGNYKSTHVALKTLRVFETREDNTKNQKAFFREIALLRCIHHQHICPIIGVDMTSIAGATCLVLPWMEYGNVLAYRSRMNWSSSDAIRLIYQIASGLAYLHEQGAAHGDLHIGNILIDSARDVRLADFGFANFFDAGASCSSGQPGATRCMAPKILNPDLFGLSRVQHTPQSDMYSFGQVAWQIYTEEIPFPSYNDHRSMFAILEGKHQERPTSGKLIPNAFWDIMLACWQFQPENRVGAAAARDNLRKLLLPEPVSARPSTITLNRLRLTSDLGPRPSNFAVINRPLPPLPEVD